MSIKKNILKVFTTNFIQLLTNAIVGFIIPAILSISEYANYKTYALYVSYLGFLHFGFPDALYIKYGGKKYEDINKKDFKNETSFFLLIEMIITFVVLVSSFLLNNKNIFLFGLTIIPYMVTTYFKSIYQAVGKFDKYTKLTNIYTISFVIINILLVFVFKIKNYVLYSCAYLIAYIIVMIITFIIAYPDFKKEKITFSLKYFSYYKTGFLIMLANLAVMLFYGIDRWFIKIFLDDYNFAYYSFAVNLVNVFITLISAISITFYNYLFDIKSKESINKIKECLLIIGSFASIGYFCISFIVYTFLEKYIPSLNIISILFANFPYIIIINVLYINIYKINKNEKKYFFVVLGMLTLAIIYNIIFLLIQRISNSIAFATLFSFVSWYIYSGIDLKQIKIKVKDIIFLIVSTITFLICSIKLNYILGGIIYFIIVFISSLILYKNLIYQLFLEFKNKLTK